MDDRHDGGCLCGAVRYRIEGAPLWVNLCFCESCRRASGAPAIAYARIPACGFTVLSGVPASFASSPSVSRAFCAACGTSLFVNGEHLGNDTVIAVATLDRAELFPPTMNVRTAERITWMYPDPQLKEWRGDDDRPKP
jgi:hypothetical protein